MRKSARTEGEVTTSSRSFRPCSRENRRYNVTDSCSPRSRRSWQVTPPPFTPSTRLSRRRRGRDRADLDSIEEKVPLHRLARTDRATSAVAHTGLALSILLHAEVS